MDLFLVNQLATFDKDILIDINEFHCIWGDYFIKLIADKLEWVPFYATMAYVILKNLDLRTSLIVIVCIALTVGFADHTCSHLLRPMFERLRPSNLDNPIHVYIHIVDNYRGGQYGMPSCHAANSMALSMYIILLFRKRFVSWFMACWTAILCYARMYEGVHYPGDILGGLIVGTAFAIIFYFITRFLIKNYNHWYTDGKKFLEHDFNNTSLIPYVGIATIVVLMIWATISMYCH